MSRIKILPEFLANQIAAGEVVERPASVVKELLENAIDAGATRAEIHIEGAGTRSIRIIDNGRGMDQDDILLSFERHATSKLTSVEQLSTITTLGFRGEAIPSIASVSKVTITSRPPSSELGSSVYVHFGSIKKVHDMGCAPGTMVEVLDLFGNVPARRKFLKTAQTELSHIDEVVRSYCLANPQIGFTYRVGGKNILHLIDNADSARKRFQALLGSEIDLIELIPQLTSSKIKVTGFLVPPDQASGKKAKLWAFVNGRFVKDRLLSHAVSEGMQGFIMKGRRPGGLVFVDLLPQDVDVNVHPTKQEVRFRNSGQVHRAISCSVSDGLKGYQQQLREKIFGAPGAISSRAEKNKNEFHQNETGVVESEKPAHLVLPDTLGKSDGRRQDSIFNKPLFPNSASADISNLHHEDRAYGAKPTIATPVENKQCQNDNEDVVRRRLNTVLKEQKTSYQSEPQSVVHQTHNNTEQSLSNSSSDYIQEGALPAIRLIGQLFSSYILCEVDDGFVVIDQHAAQERLFFEELKLQYTNALVPSQTLLFPVMVDLTVAEITALEQFSSEISRLGLDVQEFGGSTYVVNAIPASLSKVSGEEVLRDVISRFIVDEDCQSESRIDAVLAGMACKASIKAGHKLHNEEIQVLLDQMKRAGVFSHCPHGRPVVKKFTDKDVQKWFYRT